MDHRRPWQRPLLLTWSWWLQEAEARPVSPVCVPAGTGRYPDCCCTLGAGIRRVWPGLARCRPRSLYKPSPAAAGDSVSVDLDRGETGEVVK